MDCCKKNTDISVSQDFLNALMKMPFFRYFKQPVDNVSELYERYADGLEKYTFSYVFVENTFYRWNFHSKAWEPIGLSMKEALRILSKILKGYVTKKELNEILEKYVTSKELNNILRKYVTSKELNNILERYVTYKKLNCILKDYVREAPKDGQIYGRQNGQWVACQYYVPIPPVLSVNPLTIDFDGFANSQDVQVTIQNQPDASYSVTVPSWLTVSNQTQTGFTLNAGENDTGAQLSDEVVVTLDDYPDQTQTIEVSQKLIPIVQIIFDTSLGTTATLTLQIGVIIDENTVVDWGDGTITNPSLPNWNIHEYASSSQEYVATIKNMLNIPTELLGGMVQDNVVEVKVLGGIQSIGNAAYRNCHNLEKVNISGTSITSIGGYVFQDTPKFSGSLQFEYVETIGDYPFSGISSYYLDPNNPKDMLPGSPVMTFDITGSPITSLPTGTLDGVCNLTEVYLSESVSEIGGVSFRNCTALEKLVIPGNSVMIDGSAFQGCSRLHGNIKINASTIASYAFASICFPISIVFSRRLKSSSFGKQ